MAELLEIVIPLIKEEWEEVASHLRFDIDSIDAIGEKYNNDPHKCCRELLKNWLKSDHVMCFKNWYMLLRVIEKVPNLVAAKVEIINKLKNLFN